MMRSSTLLILVLLASAAVHAGQPIDQTHGVDADTLIRVSNIKGEVEIEVGDANEVRITGTLGDGVEELWVNGGGERLDIEVRQPRNSRRVEATRLKLQIPRGASVEVDTVSADVRVEGLGGARAQVETVSGDVDIAADPERVGVKTVSGDIELKSTSQRTELETVSGDIDVVEVGEELSVTTVSGELLISSKPLSVAHFESISGDMEINTSLKPRARLSISSLSGDVELFLPESLSAKVSVETFSGNIRSDRGQVRRAQFGQQSSLEFKAGDGSGRIEIESFSGNIRIRTGVR